MGFTSFFHETHKFKKLQTNVSKESSVLHTYLPARCAVQSQDSTV